MKDTKGFTYLLQDLIDQEKENLALITLTHNNLVAEERKYKTLQVGQS